MILRAFALVVAALTLAAVAAGAAGAGTVALLVFTGFTAAALLPLAQV